ncbi:MAG: GNAT family N-acetyltransferase [Candidatus Zixiibacteriota bacterium]|nr:MAG: GNAT family N-acetyltransferase [candidate division Zixibacteria bacterium]
MFIHMRLETERLIIRPFTLKDAEKLQVICSDEEVVRYLPENVMTLDEVREIIAWLLDCYQKNTPDNIVKFTVAVELKDSNELIGWCGLGPLEFAPSETEIFCGFARQFWGRGIATEAARAMLGYGFETVGLIEIAAVVHPDNVASKRVIEKMGLIYRRQFTDPTGGYRDYADYYYFSLRRDEYTGAQKRPSPDRQFYRGEN